MFCVKNEGEKPVPVSNSEVTEDEYKAALRSHPAKINEIVATVSKECITNGRTYSQQHTLPGASG